MGEGLSSVLATGKRFPAFSKGAQDQSSALSPGRHYNARGRSREDVLSSESGKISGQGIMSHIADSGLAEPDCLSAFRVQPSRAQQPSPVEASIQATNGRRAPSDRVGLLPRFLYAVVFLALASAPANAGRADWSVEKLTGSASVRTEGAWVPLHPDDQVPLGASIKTGT